MCLLDQAVKSGSSPSFWLLALTVRYVYIGVVTCWSLSIPHWRSHLELCSSLVSGPTGWPLVPAPRRPHCSALCGSCLLTPVCEHRERAQGLPAIGLTQEHAIQLKVSRTELESRLHHFLTVVLNEVLIFSEILFSLCKMVIIILTLKNYKCLGKCRRVADVLFYKMLTSPTSCYLSHATYKAATCKRGNFPSLRLKV